MTTFLIDLTNSGRAAIAMLFEIAMDDRDSMDTPHRVHVIFPADDPYSPGWESFDITTFAAREWARSALADGGHWVGSDQLDAALEDFNCRAGVCEHYVCTGGASLDEWDEPEPTDWDYKSEAFGGTVGDPAGDAYPYAS